MNFGLTRLLVPVDVMTLCCIRSSMGCFSYLHVRMTQNHDVVLLKCLSNSIIKQILMLHFDYKDKLFLRITFRNGLFAVKSVASMHKESKLDSFWTVDLRFGLFVSYFLNVVVQSM